MSEQLRFHVCQTDLGWVGIAVSGRGLRATTLPRESRDAALREVAEMGALEPASASDLNGLPGVIADLVAGRPYTNALPIDWSGITPFRRAVMEECLSIPAGQTRTYAELAVRVGRPGAARAVGRVMATNPLPLLVPCHRVVGSSGGLHGYGGGLPMKAALLKAEGAIAGPVAG